MSGISTSFASALGALVPLPRSSALDLAAEDLPPALEAKLRALQPVLLAVHSIRPYILSGFTVIAGLVIVAVLVAGLLGHVRRPAAWRYVLLGVLAFPPATTLMMALSQPATTRAVVLGALGSWALVWGLAVVAASAGGPRRALAGLLLATAALILVDQWLGGPWSYTGVLGYSPLDGARFYGLGNEGASLLFGAALVGGGLVVDACPPGGRADVFRWLCLPLLGAVVVLTCAAPTLGANITVAIWGTFGFAVAAFLASGRRIKWWHLALVAAGSAALVAAFAVVDLSRPDGGTHLAALIRSVEAHGPGALGAMLGRKVAMNVGMLKNTPASLLALVGLAWLGYSLARPSARIREALAARPALRASLWGAVAGSALALVTEDSGVVIPALVLLYACGALAYVLTLQSAEDAVERPVPLDPGPQPIAEGAGE